MAEDDEKGAGIEERPEMTGIVYWPRAYTDNEEEKGLQCANPGKITRGGPKEFAGFIVPGNWL